MDATGVSVLFFGLLKLGIWLGVLAFAVWLWRTIQDELNPKVDSVEAEEDSADPPNPELVKVLWQKWYWLAGWIMTFFAAIMFTQIEAGYRPKTTIQPVNHALEQQLLEIDRAPAPVIAPAEGDLRDKANAGYSERNAADNAAAREAFESLPDDKE